MMDAIDSYLDDLAARLRIGPARARRLLVEAEAHLREAVGHEVEAGADRQEAERRALERFGTARRVAAAANGPVSGRLPSLARAVAALSALGSVTVLVGTLLARAAASLTSTSGVFGLPAGVQPAHDRLTHWLAVQPGAAGWHSAAAAENADDTLLLRGGFAVICLVISVVVLGVLRRRPEPLLDPVISAVGLTAFGGAAVVLLAGALANVYTPMEWGRGLWWSDAVAALVAAAVCAVALLRTLRTA